MNTEENQCVSEDTLNKNTFESRQSSCVPVKRIGFILTEQLTSLI